MSKPTSKQIEYRTKLFTEPCLKCGMLVDEPDPDNSWCYKNDKRLEDIKDCVTRDNLRKVMNMQGGTWNPRYPPRRTVGMELDCKEEKI